MDLEDPLILSPEEQLRVDQTFELFWNLMTSERSRYETQARELIEIPFPATEQEKIESLVELFAQSEAESFKKD